MSKKYDYDKAGVILRASPAHLGHRKLIRNALTRADKVTVLIGSARSAKTVKNPFDLETRIHLLASMFTKEENSRIDYVGLPDDLYNMERWIGRLQERLDADYKDRVALISSKKDNDHIKRSNWVPFWDTIGVDEVPGLNATDLRTILFSGGGPCIADTFNEKSYALLENVLNCREPEEFGITASTQSFLNQYVRSTEYERLADEWLAIQEFQTPEKIAMEQGIIKYPIQHQTVDAIVICAGHFLLVRRGGRVGNGLLAFPGGFLEKGETQLEGALRELEEETKLDIPPMILRSNIAMEKTFDHPQRSNLGRLITQAFIIHLPPQGKTAKGDRITKGGVDRLDHGMPKVKGADDAKEAMWVPIYKFKQLADQMHDDHYDMGIFARDKINSFYR